MPQWIPTNPLRTTLMSFSYGIPGWFSKEFVKLEGVIFKTASNLQIPVENSVEKIGGITDGIFGRNSTRIYGKIHIDTFEKFN